MLNKCIYLPSGGINAMLYVLMYTERLRISTSVHQSSCAKNENRETENQAKKGIPSDFKSVTLCIDWVVDGSPVIWLKALFLSLHSSDKHNQAAPRSFPLTLLGATAV